jgi:hypothetical protein
MAEVVHRYLGRGDKAPCAYPIVSANHEGSVGGAPVISEDSARIPGEVR